jgi:hypothetical protein
MARARAGESVRRASFAALYEADHYGIYGYGYRRASAGSSDAGLTRRRQGREGDVLAVPNEMIV